MIVKSLPQIEKIEQVAFLIESLQLEALSLDIHQAEMMIDADLRFEPGW